jgi:hypothetical protein
MLQIKSIVNFFRRGRLFSTDIEKIHFKTRLRNLRRSKSKGGHINNKEGIGEEVFFSFSSQ